MELSSILHRSIDTLFEHAPVFNLNQVILDGGKHRPVRRFLADITYSSVIDLGCGPGNWAELARGHYVGVDTSAAFIAACRRKYGDDPAKEFARADVADVALSETYDLALMISVLHHLSDEQVVRTLRRISGSTRYLFILDLYPVPRNPVSRWLYSMDRGRFIREPEAQKRLIARAGRHQLMKEDSFYSWNRLYRHTMFLYRSEATP